MLKSELNTEILDRCVKLMNLNRDGDENVIREMLNLDLKMGKDLVDPFKKEINFNLLSKETALGKKDLIAYYIYEFNDMPSTFNQNKEYILEGTLSYNTPEYRAISHTNKDGVQRRLNDLELYYVHCHELFDCIFYEIQLCCIKYKIDFYEICRDLKFQTNLFDDGISMFYNEKENVDTQSKKQPADIPDTLHDFFDQINDGTLTQLEIYNRVQQLTDNFDLEKLHILLNDFDFYFFMLRENKLAEYSSDDIAKAITELEEKGRPIPYIKLPVLKTKNGEVTPNDNVIDVPKLLYPFDFYYCYRFQNYFQKELEERGKQSNQKEETAQPKTKIKSNAKDDNEYFLYTDLTHESSRIASFCDQLKKYKFLHEDTRLTDFKKIFSGKAIQGIIWIGSDTELKHCFKLLYSDLKKVKKVRGSHWKVVCSYFVNELGEPYDYKKFRNLKVPHPTRVALLERIAKAL